MLVPEKQHYNQYEELDCPWVPDILQERFDDAMIMLDEGCIIYGGAIRDIFANLPILGDLDVAIPPNIFRTINTRFLNSTRWENRCQAPLRLQSGSANPTTAKKIISEVKTFRNINRDAVQLIVPELQEGQRVQGIDMGIIDIVMNVDICCCGIMSNIFGTVIEIIPGAIEDCKNKVLRFNNKIKATKTSIDKLNKRITKLEKRGWTNKIDVSKVKLIKEAPAVSSIFTNDVKNTYLKF